MAFGSGESVEASTAKNIIQDDILSRINVDELVFILINNYNFYLSVIVTFHISTHSNFDEDTKLLLINLVRKNWVTVSNIIFRHPERKPELHGPISRTVRQEFTAYCGNKSDSILQRRSPIDVAAFSDKVVVREVQTLCRFWHACLQGACNANAKNNKITVKVTGCMALSSSIVARCRNPNMSAMAYRISTILFHSGVKHQDITKAWFVYVIKIYCRVPARDGKK